MPTGYTAPVQDGTVTDLTDFALTCARGFGAMVLLRDSEQSLEATRRFIEERAYAEESSYYQRSLDASHERVAQLRAMSDEDAIAAARAAHDEVVENNRASEEKRLVELARYEAMVEKVEAWEPPTEEHASFKDFMLEQLRESIKFDCRPFSMTPPAVSLAWRDAEIERERQNVKRCTEEIVKERGRNDGRIEWVTALLDSFLRGRNDGRIEWVTALLDSLEGVPA